ncbi:MAG: hypothetical protein AB1478_12055 [Nitrospirota bacterium]
MKKEYYQQARKISEEIFKAKDKTRIKWANIPIEEKMKELVRLQEIAVRINPELKKYRIPFKL